MHVEGLDDAQRQPDDMRVRVVVSRHLIAVVHQDEEEVKAAHDGSRQVHVLLQTLAAIVAAAHRVGGGQDGGAGVKCGLRGAEKGVSQGNCFVGH